MKMEKNGEETHARSIVKGFSWRILATTITIILVFVFTGEVILAFGVGGLEFFSKFIVYYLHERVWNKIKWGR